MRLTLCGLLGAIFGSTLCYFIPGHPFIMGVFGGVAGAVIVLVVGDAYERR